MKRLIGTLITAALCLTLLSGCAGSGSDDPDAALSSDLRIAIADLSSDISFIDYSAGGTAMQLIARVDGAGAPKLSYNTCQSCQGSPYAYFEVQGGALVCRNCGNRFSFDTVGEKRSGGCMPIAVEDYVIEDGYVVISAQTLNGMKQTFANWKKGL